MESELLRHPLQIDCRDAAGSVLILARAGLIKSYETGKRHPSRPYLTAILVALKVGREDRNATCTGNRAARTRRLRPRYSPNHQRRRIFFA